MEQYLNGNDNVRVEIEELESLNLEVCEEEKGWQDL